VSREGFQVPSSPQPPASQTSNTELGISPALIEGLDPEEARAIIDPALQLMMDAVHRYEGYVAQALGDGIFALFGAPIAHEDHPQRALFAALRMQEEMRRYGDQVRLTHGVPLAMRVGVNTGEVVVRSIRKDDLHTDYVPVGYSTNLAARMEQMATPGSILITDYTRKLTEGYFELKALGAAEIKGVEAPLNVYEVLGAGPLRTRLQVTATRRGLTRFVGRQSEMEQLRHALEHARAGHGQIVGVMGEPGLGKSRLFYEFKLLSHSGCLVLDAYSVSHGKATAYLPVIELLKSYFRIESQDDERTAQAMETLYQVTLDEHYSELAYHYTRSGNTEKAVEYLHLAGQQAVQRSANMEAITHLTTALELLQTLPDTRERAQQELTLHLTLGPPLRSTRGVSSLEVQATYTRAWELCQQVGEPRQLFAALFGRRAFHAVRGEFRPARELGEQLLSLAEQEHDPAWLAEAY
jgi:class 3 adenylate cyclase